MQIKIFVKSIETPNSLDDRQGFTFDNASTIAVEESEFGNFCVTIISDEAPLISYRKGPFCYGCRCAEDADLNAYCDHKGNAYTFPYVQKNCVHFGRGVFD